MHSGSVKGTSAQLAKMHETNRFELVRLAGAVEEVRSLVAKKFSSLSCPFEAKTSLGTNEPTRLIRSLPTHILYDSKGLDLFDKITYTPEYYLTNCEIEICKKYGQEIASYVQDGSSLVELGVGYIYIILIIRAMRKTGYLLEPISLSGKQVTYYAIDLEETSLVAALKDMSASFPSINFVGLLGTYEEGVEYLSSHLPSKDVNPAPRLALWLGSSIGNMNREEARNFFSFIDSKILDIGDFFLVGIDGRNDPKTVSKAYNDSKGLTDEFIMNGLDNINELFGKNVFDRSNFEYLSIYNDVLGRHEAYYRSLSDQSIRLDMDKVDIIKISKEELIHIEYSYKYSKEEAESLAHDSKFSHTQYWADQDSLYCVYLFQKPPFFFPKVVQDSRCPTLDEYKEVWKSWYSPPLYNQLLGMQLLCR